MLDFVLSNFLFALQNTNKCSLLIDGRCPVKSVNYIKKIVNPIDSPFELCMIFTFVYLYIVESRVL